jgi:hypothetical protein
MKIRSVEAELFQADGRTDGQMDKTDLTKPAVAFRSFANAPKNAEFTYKLNKRLDTLKRLMPPA